MNPSDLTGNARRSLRLSAYDYASCGAYFVTLCAHRRRPVFGRVLAGEMNLNVYGEMVRDEWNTLPHHFSHLELDVMQIMPNHVHAILVISNVGAGFPRPNVAPNAHFQNENRFSPEVRAGKPRPYVATLGQIVGYWKYQNTKKINLYRAEKSLAPARVWQRNFHDRVLRDERELNAARRYILENPLRWEEDDLNR